MFWLCPKSHISFELHLRALIGAVVSGESQGLEEGALPPHQVFILVFSLSSLSFL